jgi:hypothetical protein
MYIDQSVYSDLDDPPDVLETPEDKADYVHRICAAWDFYIHPEPQTFELFAGWKDIFDRFPIPTSPSYHAFRSWFKWDPVPYPTDVPAPTPMYVHLDRIEGRPDDPCTDMV